MHRFVITVGGTPPAEVAAYLGRPDVPALSYTPAGHFTWRSIDEATTAAGWWTEEPAHRRHDDGSLTAWAGNLRVARSPGRPGAELLRDALHHDPYEPRALLHDAYAIAHLDENGAGFAAGDELSLHPIFVARPAPGITVLGDRPLLVAEVAARWGGTHPVRSVESAQWMSFAGYVVGETTGFEGVSMLPPGSLMRIESGHVGVEEPPPLYAGSPTDTVDLETFTDAFEQQIGDALRHALALGERPHLELTGGKDSRLLFAVAHRAGLLGEFEVTSYGPSEIPDVRIAAELCALVGVPHNHIRSRKLPATPTYGSIERIRRHTHRSCGVSQIGDAVEPSPHGPVVVSGLFGEYYRVDHAGEARNPATSLAEALARFPIQRRFGTSGILTREVTERLAAEALAHVVEAADHVRTPADLRAAFTIRYRFPAWQNPLIDRNTATVLPFASGSMVREAFRLAHEDRCLELPHRVLMERADPRIARHPLANSAWRTPKPKPRRKPQPLPPKPKPAPLPPVADRLRRVVPRPVRHALHPLWRIVQRGRTPEPVPPPPVPAPDPPRPTTDIEPTPAIEGPSSVRKVRDWLPVSRRDLVGLIESDPHNPVFDFIDRDALLTLVTGEGPGDPLADMQVNGAITAFLWLGSHDLPSRTDG